MKFVVTLTPIIVLSLLLFGCAGQTGMNSKNLGSIEEDRRITRQYEELTINPDFNYYYYGRELQPDVIMGIGKDYQVQSEFWHLFDLMEDQLETWVIWGYRNNRTHCDSGRYMGRYMGAVILDPAGKPIGDWYSRRDWGIFEFPGGNTVIPHPPRNYEGWSIQTCP